jgi:hypothetical protein
MAGVSQAFSRLTADFAAGEVTHSRLRPNITSLPLKLMDSLKHPSKSLDTAKKLTFFGATATAVLFFLIDFA